MYHRTNNTNNQALEMKFEYLKPVDFEIYIVDRKANIPVYRQSFFCSTVLTPQH